MHTRFNEKPLGLVITSLPICALAGLVLSVVFSCNGVFAQAVHHPFAVGANEGAVGNVSGFGAWIIAQESAFYRLMTQALHSIKNHTSAGWDLAAVSFAYGVFHAAGPGHGKAVVASYMVSNERALRRGLVISLLAALLQGVVAVALIGIAALIFHATAPRMTAAAGALETLSYAGIIVLGGILLWRKGAALLAACIALQRAPVEQMFATSAVSSSAIARGNSAFFSDDGGAQQAQIDGHIHRSGCGHFHGLDSSQLDEGFVWKGALLTVLTAGARPCSGAILVLVFALAQDMFLAGIGATFAMSLGTAITTGVLAAFAVVAKRAAMTYAGPGSPRALILGRLIEVAAAICVLLFGVALLIAQWMGFNLTAL
jgi:nickel/cobalt exporter